MNAPSTHLAISTRLVGEPLALEEGRASARLLTTADMAADERGLVHGGFVFGLADYAGMLAVNDPNVVLGSADLRFVAPVEVGEEVIATASVVKTKGKKREIEVSAKVGDRTVIEGKLVAFVLEHHVLGER